MLTKTVVVWQFVVDEGAGLYNKVVARLFDKDNTGHDDPLGRYCC